MECLATCAVQLQHHRPLLHHRVQGRNHGCEGLPSVFSWPAASNRLLWVCVGFSTSCSVAESRSCSNDTCSRAYVSVCVCVTFTAIIFSMNHGNNTLAAWSELRAPTAHRSRGLQHSHRCRRRNLTKNTTRHQRSKKWAWMCRTMLSAKPRRAGLIGITAAAWRSTFTPVVSVQPNVLFAWTCIKNSWRVLCCGGGV